MLEDPPRGRWRGPLIVAAALILAISLLSLGLKRGPALQRLEGLLISLSAPGLQAFHYVGHTLRRGWEDYFNLVGVRQENTLLKQRLEEYSQKEARYQEALQSLTRLEALLELKRQVALPICGARVIAYDPSMWSRCALIDKGKEQGVTPGMAVLAAGGIVGRVVESYPQYAKVMLLVDRNSGADAMVQRLRVRGILQGKGGNRCSLEYVPKSIDLQVGDLVLSSGLGGVFPQGMILGKVTAADKKTPGVFQEVEVTPAVDLSALEEVAVVKAAHLALSP